MSIDEPLESTIVAAGSTGPWSHRDRETPPTMPGALINRQQQGFPKLQLGQVWAHRELIWFLGARDVRIRYKQMFLGGLWAVMHPLAQMALYAVVFGYIAKLPAENGLPYGVFIFTALVPWQYFANSLSAVSMCMVTNQNLIQKIAFPRLVLPVSAMIAPIVDMVVAMCVAMLMLVVFGFSPQWRMLLIPLFFPVAALTAFAIGIWLSAINVRYRDVQHLIPFAMLFWFYLTPVVYSKQLVPDGLLRYVCELNPMQLVTTGVRWAALGTDPPQLMSLASLPLLLVMLVCGLYYFRRSESSFADVV